MSASYPGGVNPPSAPPFLVYTVLRLGLFVAVLAVVGLLGARGWLLLVIAAVVSFALSYVLLRGPRERLAAQVADRVGERTDPARRKQSKLDDDARAEDAAADDLGRADRPPPSDPPRP